MGKGRNIRLNDGARVAVIGGGPAGSFFSYFLLSLAERVGRKIQVDIYEPRNFNKPGPAGCNMCAGVVSETLVQYLAAEGINLPPTVVERGIDSYMLHMDVGSVHIESALHEKRIATLHRGIGPRDLREIKWASFDNYLLTLASNKGAHVIHQRVVEINRTEGQVHLRSQNGSAASYDLVTVAVGVNTAALKLFEGLGFDFKPPQTAKCLLREYYLGEEVIEKYIGSSMHTFLLNIPHLEFAALIPKGDYVSLALLGDQIDKKLLKTFLTDPAVKRCLPPDFPVDQPSCWCAPRINVKGSNQPYGDQIVFIGDSGVTRLCKDGIGAAYRTAKAAARTAIFHGISAEDFRRHYWPICRALETDNFIGKLIFTVVRQLQKKRFARRAILNMVTQEQQGLAYAPQGLSLVLWDMFTGSAPYGDVFRRTLHPAFWTRLLGHTIGSLWSLARRGPKPKNMDAQPAPSTQQNGVGISTSQLLKEYAMQTTGLGKVYQDGEIIIRQGDVGDNVFVIQEGQVEVVVEQNGQEIRLAVQGAGKPIGEMALLEHQVRSATVRALGQARILTLDKKSLVRRIHEDPSLAYYMMQTMSQRVRELNAEVARLERQHPESGTIAKNWPNSTTCPSDCSNRIGAAVFHSPVVLS